MTILDVWNNPLGVPTTTAFGYRGEYEEFPHDLYSFLQSSVREADQKDVALLYRWMRPMQNFWEQEYYAIHSLSNLYSPEDCPEELLNYLRKNIGILDDLSYLWGVLTTNERRRLIKYFVRFLTYRGTDYGIAEMITTMTGYPIMLRNYFFYRWLLSGDTDLYMETALGCEDEAGYDPWIISEEETPIGYEPDLVSILTDPVSGDDYYLIEVTSLVDAVTNPPVPLRVAIRCRVTGETVFDHLYQSGSQWYVRLLDDYFFGQSDLSRSTTTTDFQCGFEIDQYVSDILVVDDGLINRDMVKGLIRFARPMSERFYIRYYKLIEDFKSIDGWETIAGTAEHNSDDKTVTIGDAAVETIFSLDYLSSDTWDDYGFVYKGQMNSYSKYYEIRFMVQDSDNYYYFQVERQPIPTFPNATWELGSCVAGVRGSLDTGTIDSLDIDIDYTWRVECFQSIRPGGAVQIIRCYQDENILVDYVEDPISWLNAYGSIQFVVEDGAEWLVDRIRCHPIPGEYDFVGPTV